MIKKIDVYASKIKVGTLALTNDNRVAFQYTNEWVKNGFSINPFKLPLSMQLFFASSPFLKDYLVSLRTLCQIVMVNYF